MKNINTSWIPTDKMYVSNYFVFNDIVSISDKDFDNVLIEKPIYSIDIEKKDGKINPMKTLFHLEPISEDNESSDIIEGNILETQPYIPLRFYVR